MTRYKRLRQKVLLPIGGAAVAAGMVADAFLHLPAMFGAALVFVLAVAAGMVLLLVRESRANAATSANVRDRERVGGA